VIAGECEGVYNMEEVRRSVVYRRMAQTFELLQY